MNNEPAGAIPSNFFQPRECGAAATVPTGEALLSSQEVAALTDEQLQNLSVIGSAQVRINRRHRSSTRGVAVRNNIRVARELARRTDETRLN